MIFVPYVYSVWKYLPHHGGGPLEGCGPALHKLVALALAVLDDIVGQIEQDQAVVHANYRDRGIISLCGTDEHTANSPLLKTFSQHWMIFLWLERCCRHQFDICWMPSCVSFSASSRVSNSSSSKVSVILIDPTWRLDAQRITIVYYVFWRC